MSKTQPQIKRSLFISSLLRGSVEACSRRLMGIGDTAHSLRDFKTLALIGAEFSECPAGAYFGALALNHSPAGRVQAETVLQELASYPSPLQPRLRLALGSNELRQDNPDNAIQLYSKAQSGNSLTRFLSALMTAQALGRKGEHSSAVKLLEGIQGMAITIGQQLPAYFFAWLNALAVELGEVGQRERALKLSRIAARSRYSVRYPEWQATHVELLSAQPRGLVAVPEMVYEGEIIAPTKTDAVCRIERVLCNPDYSAVQLHRYAEAGEKVL